MSVYKNQDSGTWYSICRFTDWKGVRKQKCRRGFTTKREALEWEREFLMQRQADVDMTFDSFVQLYEKDIKPKLKLNTWLTKESIIQKKILPYFKDRKLSEITAKDIMDWQNEIRSLTDSKGKPYSTTYLKTVHNQFSCIFNHAIKYYGLQINPAARAGNMGSEEKKEMLFWTKAEYLKFIDAMMDKPLSFYAFEMLYWCGIREGELLALTSSDFDFAGSSVSINKSYQRLKGQDIISTPKTKKSNRVIKMSQFLCDEMQDYIKMFYNAGKDDRIFPVSKHYLKHEMERGCKETGVKRIRIHDIRHSHVSLLIDMGFSALAIADRVGHESIDITYRYAHLFPSRQTEMAEKLNFERTEKEAYPCR
jgi:integrase